MEVDQEHLTLFQVLQKDQSLSKSNAAVILERLTKVLKTFVISH